MTCILRFWRHICLQLSATSKCNNHREYLWESACIKLCASLCVQVFYLLTLRTGIPVLRACWLNSQRDTERGQSEQRSFVQSECGHEKFQSRMVCVASQSCFFKSNFPLAANLLLTALKLGVGQVSYIAFDTTSHSTSHQRGISEKTNPKKKKSVLTHLNQFCHHVYYRIFAEA